MKFKLDENLSRHLKDVVSSLGHDAATAAEEDLLARSDREVAAAACAEDRVLLTLDVEFGNLKKYPPGSHPGIMVFRPGRLGPLAVNRFVQEFLGRTDVRRLARCVVIVQPSRVRIRWPPGESGERES